MNYLSGQCSFHGSREGWNNPQIFVPIMCELLWSIFHPICISDKAVVELQ